MTNPEVTEQAAVPRAIVHPAHKRRVSLVWLVPLIAALIGGWLVLQSYLNEGPTITLRFASAEGIEPGKTKLRFKDVDIGEVKTVSVSKDRTQVILTAKLVKDASDYLVSDTRFWIVRPRIAAGNVSGLGTLLSGAYIGVDIGKSREPKSDFVGLEIPPIVTGDLPGREFVLRSSEIGSLGVGSVVSFRRVPVGQVIAYQLDPDGKGVTLKIFVNAPYDQFVTENSRFWHASGFELSMDATGVKLETQSLVSLVEGGVAFQTPGDQVAGLRAVKDATFRLYADREMAMRSPDKEILPFTLYFKESLRGLSHGAPVDFHGVVMGEVKSVGVEYDEVHGRFRFPVTIDIFPDRMRSHYVAGTPQPLMGDKAHRTLVDRLVKSGMRAQLKTGSLITGQLFIALDFFADAPEAKVDWAHSPPVLPSTGGGLAEIQDSMASILKKVDQIPMDQLSGQLATTLKTMNKTLDDTDRLINSLNADVAPEARATLGQARQTLNAAQRMLESDSPLQVDLRELLRQVSRSAQEIGSLADYLDRHPESLIRGKPASQPAEPEAGVRP